MSSSKLNKAVDKYLIDGCGRCKLYMTPQCKVHTWSTELKLLRSLLNECNLTEELKWSMPCYTHEGKNILILAAFKEYCSISFFKGALLKDSKKLLSSPGENSQATRQFRFTNVKEIEKLSSSIKAYVKEAIELQLKDQLGVMHMVLGYDSTLGKDREGNAARLAEIGLELGYTVETEQLWAMKAA